MPAESVPVRHCPVLWAQRKDVVYITLDVEDCTDPDVNFSEDKLQFKGHGGPDHLLFEAELPFFDSIDVENIRKISTSRNLQFVIPKQTGGTFWPRLLKPTTKLHYVKVDFNKWKDEDDESDEEQNPGDLGDLMSKMGGGYGGMPGMGGMPDLGNFEDSDDEDMPDLEDAVGDHLGKHASNGAEGDSEGEEGHTGETDKGAPPVTKTTPVDEETPVVDASTAT